MIRANFIVLLLISVMISGVVMAADRGFVVLPDDSAGGDDFKLYDGSYALLIGVSDYTDGWNDLKQIPFELKAAKTALESHGFEVTLELEKTTAAELPGVFTAFKNKHGYGQNNRLVFIYSGHGHTWEEGDQGYLVPSDAPIPGDGYPGSEFLGKVLHISQIMEWSRQMTARHALFLFDSCFSGTIFNNKSLDDARKRTGRRFDLKSAKRKVRQFITAGSADEVVPAKSIFMPAFVDAITLGEADLYEDGVITGAELGLYLRNEVAQYGDQSPQYGTHPNRDLAKGDLVFVMAEPASVDVEPNSVEEPESVGVPAKELDERRSVRPAVTETVTVQRVLKAKGYYQGPIDGIWGPASQAALVAMATDVDRDPKDLIQSIVENSVTDVASVSGTVSGQGLSDAASGVSGTEPVKRCDDCPKMVRIPGGTFEMGSNEGDDDEKPARTVTVQAFEMSETEVTFDQYDAFVEATGRELPDDEDWGRGDRPVINVSWDDAVAYAQWLSEQTGDQYRLPTEAEWEYAARAGTTTKYWWGDDVGRNQANCDGCESQWDDKETASVKSFTANAFGLYDTSGNVSEWVEDCWHKNYHMAPDNGSAWLDVSDGDCGSRVLRGGSWFYFAVDVRSANRRKNSHDLRNNFVGFRLTRTL